MPQTKSLWSVLSGTVPGFLMAIANLFWLFPAQAAELSFSDAAALIGDTYAVSQGCVSHEGQEARNLMTDKAIVAVALCGVDLMEALPPGQVRKRFFEADAGWFKNLPDKYNSSVSSEILEKSALRFTGHALARHQSFGDVGLFTDVDYQDGMYYYMADGLGGMAPFMKLARVETKEGIYILHGELFTDADQLEKIGSFTVTVAPGAVPGSWKRLSVVEKVKYPE